MIDFIKELSKVLAARIPHWFRLIAPILLGSALIGIVISTIWFGGKRESLAAYAESNLLRFALNFSVRPADNHAQVVVISVRDADLHALDKAPLAPLKDAHITEYAAVLERVASTNPKLMVVSWLGNAQPLTVDYLQPLTDTIDRLGIADKTILAIHFYATGSVPEELSRKYQIAEARDCYYEVNSFCTWNPSWSWMPQRIANAFWKEKAPWTLSTNLPHTLPNFVLNLPDITSIPTFSFLDFKQAGATKINEGAVIFIGNDSTQDIQFRNNKDLLQRTFVASSPSTRSLMTDGIPFHVFWAGMAQMFIDGRTIAVVPAWLCRVALVLMCLLIMVSIRYLRGTALGPFLLCALSLPLLNALGLRYAGVYMPVVPIIAAGFALFIAATFISISVYSYRRWRLLAAEGAAEQTADIKENFISLISHNLNTPIAQLKGLLDVLIYRQKGAPTNLTQALVYLEYMRITVRAVLNTSWITENAASVTPVTVRQFWDHLLESEQTVMNRMKISLQALPSRDDEEFGEIWYYRFSIERETCISALFYGIFLAHVRFNALDLTLTFSAIQAEPAAPQGLIVRVDWVPVTHTHKHPFSVDFVAHALTRYLEAAREFRGISVHFETNALVFTIPDAYLKTKV